MQRRAVDPGNPRGRYVVVALGLTMLLAVALAVVAQRTADSHRGTAKRVLQDYAAFAAEAYANRAAQRLAGAAYPVLNGLTQAGTGRPGGRLPDAAPAGSFRLPLPSGPLTLTGPDSGADLSRWIGDTVRFEAAHGFRPEWYLALVFGTDRRKETLLVYTVARDSATRTSVAYGYTAPVTRLGKLFEELAMRGALLPASLTGGVVVDSVAEVVVATPAHQVLFAMESRYGSTFQGRKSLDPIFGGLTVQVTLRPGVANRLIIGGLPPSRLPLLLGLVGLAVVLAVTAALQLHREQELTRLRGDFVASVSHELRTPLAQLRMFTETLLLGRVRSEQERRRSLEILDQEARRLTHLVDNLLYVARGERNPQPLTLELVELAPVVREIAESFAPLAQSSGTRVELSLQEGVRARVDRGALRQILLNLLDNAVKYGPAGGTVALAVEPVASGVRIRVDDEGPGVPHAERARVWERFARLGRDLESAVAGSGIGLAIVRDLVVAHGGSCRIEDAPAGGARFLVELPA